MSSLFINVNGKMLPADTAGIAPASRAFRYGYGLFETMLMHEGRIRLEAYHWERLREGIAALQLAIPAHFFSEIKEAVRKTIRRNSHEARGRIRLQVWPGSGGFYDGDAFTANYCIESFGLPAAIFDLNENGLVTGIAQGIVKAADAFSHIKSCNALPYALAARQAKAARWNDALLLNAQGRIADSTIANVFWMKDDQIFTPPLSEGCVAGVMRRHLLATLPDSGYIVKEQAIMPAFVKEADAIFLSNAIRGIQWVSSLDDCNYGRGIVPELREKVLRYL